jgi:hypothetical protein
MSFSSRTSKSLMTSFTYGTPWIRYEIFNRGLFNETLYGSRVEIAFQTHTW